MTEGPGPSRTLRLPPPTLALQEARLIDSRSWGRGAGWLQHQQARLLRTPVLWCAIRFSKGQELSLSLFSDPGVKLWLKRLASGPLRSRIKGTHVVDSCWSLLPGKGGPYR